MRFKGLNKQTNHIVTNQVMLVPGTNSVSGRPNNWMDMFGPCDRTSRLLNLYEWTRKAAKSSALLADGYNISVMAFEEYPSIRMVQFVEANPDTIRLAVMDVPCGSHRNATVFLHQNHASNTIHISPVFPATGLPVLVFSVERDHKLQPVSETFHLDRCLIRFCRDMGEIWDRDPATQHPVSLWRTGDLPTVKYVIGYLSQLGVRIGAFRDGSLWMCDGDPRNVRVQKTTSKVVIRRATDRPGNAWADEGMPPFRPRHDTAIRFGPYLTNSVRLVDSEEGIGKKEDGSLDYPSYEGLKTDGFRSFGMHSWLLDSWRVEPGTEISRAIRWHFTIRNFVESTLLAESRYPTSGHKCVGCQLMRSAKKFPVDHIVKHIMDGVMPTDLIMAALRRRRAHKVGRAWFTAMAYAHPEGCPTGTPATQKEVQDAFWRAWCLPEEELKPHGKNLSWRGTYRKGTEEASTVGFHVLTAKIAVLIEEFILAEFHRHKIIETLPPEPDSYVSSAVHFLPDSAPRTRLATHAADDLRMRSIGWGLFNNSDRDLTPRGNSLCVSSFTMGWVKPTSTGHYEWGEKS